MINKKTLSILIFLILSLPAFSQQVYHGCGMDGKAKSARVKHLNELKNRYNLPEAKDFNKAVTLKALLQPGSDEKRWSDNKAAEITGYVYRVMAGGVESCNCYAISSKYRDTHIELILDPKDHAKSQRVIVEVTPRFRAMMKEKGIDWSTKGLKKEILHKWIKVQGWLFFDEEHKSQSENTNPGMLLNWRATAWEIHPVTNIEVVNAPKD